MLYLIVGIILIALAWTIIKKVGGVLLSLIKGLFTIIFLAIYFAVMGPALLCSWIFHGITKLLHLQKFIYFVLGFLSFPSFIYTCRVNIPYSKKEKFIDVPLFFDEKRKERNKATSISFFLTMEGLSFFAVMYTFTYDDDIFYLLRLIGLFNIIFSLIYSIYKCSKWKKENKANYQEYADWRTWTLQETTEETENDIEEELAILSQSIINNDKKSTTFYYGSIPFGRATAFISYFNKNLEEEEPVYFSVKMSTDENEIREYGILITSKGIYISDKGNQDVEVPFEGLWKVHHLEKSYLFDYGLNETVKLEKSNLYISTDKLETLIDKIQENNIPLKLLQDNIKTDLDEAFESYRSSQVETADKKFNTNQNMSTVAKTAELGGIGATLTQNSNVYAEVKNNFDGAKGHGTAAEYANNAIDRITGNNVQALGESNAKGGADRLVNGQYIQTKYYETGRKSINAAFDKEGNAIYKNNDGSMMQIEVPRDKYNDAVKAMQERIDAGEVPGGTNQDARKYVRKGRITYLQAYNVAGSGSIESIAIDVTQGIVCSLPGAGITAVLTFAGAVWNGQDLKIAAKQSSIAGLKVMGKGAAIFAVTMQLSRGKVVNPLYSVMKSLGKENANKYLNNPVSAVSRKIVKKFNPGLKGAELAKGSRKLISGTATTVVVFGPDVLKTVQGKISGKQFIKNSTVNTAGLVGAALGTAIPIPFVGSMIGVAAASFVAKKIMDNFIEDDAVQMYRIFREEFLDGVMIAGLDKEEFDTVATATIGNKEMFKFLQNMYQSGQPREYVKLVIAGEVQSVYAKREKVTNKMINEGMQLLLEDKSEAA